MPTNKERAERAATIINLYSSSHDYVGELAKDILPDVIADMMHFCDESDPHISFDDALRVASMHHTAEVLEPEEENSKG